MREGYRFQIRPEYRSLVQSLLAAGTNSLMKGTVRIGEVGDENYRRIRDLQETLQQKNGQELFAGWRIDRSYSAEEIEGAELFLIKIPFTHLAAEEYGALYLEQGEVHLKQSHDEFKEVGERFSSFGKVPTRAIEQTSLLRLPVYKLPTRKI